MTTALLLAAGSSRRFGPTCKLQAMYQGKPLVRHPADAILQAGLQAVAVVADPAVESLLPEFRIVRVYPGPQSQSLRAGLDMITDDRALVVLGDMPHLDAALLLRIASAPAPAAAFDGSRIMPPASIPVTMFPEVTGLTGDRGAASLLQTRADLCKIRVSRHVLKDVDLLSDLE